MAKVGHITLTQYVYGGIGSGSASEGLQGTRTKAIPTDDAVFDEVDSTDSKYSDGVRSKISYRNDPTGLLVYTNETVAQLAAQSNGTLSAS
jgi:hypothetical protein